MSVEKHICNVIIRRQYTYEIILLQDKQSTQLFNNKDMKVKSKCSNLVKV